MPDRRDDRNLRSSHRSRQTFVIERSQILGGPSAPRDDDDFDLSCAIEMMKPGSDLNRSRLSLHLRRIDQNASGMMPARQNIQDVPQCRSLRRCDDPDPQRQRRAYLLPRTPEKPPPLERRLLFFQPESQSARTPRLPK